MRKGGRTMSNCKVIALTNQKKAVQARPSTAVNLGVGLAKQGNKVLLIDADAQAKLNNVVSATARPDDLSDTLSSIMQCDVIDDKPANVQKAILHHDEGVDLLPSNIELSGTGRRLINAISRESVLKTRINEVKKELRRGSGGLYAESGYADHQPLRRLTAWLSDTKPLLIFPQRGLELLLRSVSRSSGR